MEQETKSHGSSQREELTETNADGTTTTYVRYTVDLHNLPPLSEERKQELRELAARPDSEIDYSDIPELTEEWFRNAKPNPFFRPLKSSTTVRIDADVLHWLRSGGKGWQSRINAILRREMLEAVARERGAKEREAK